MEQIKMTKFSPKLAKDKGDLASPEVLSNNNQHPPLVKREIQTKHWFFTYNNYPIGAMEQLEQVFKNICEKYIFEKEIGESGTPHLQGCITLKKKGRWSEFKLPNTIHWQATKNVECAVKYCSKDYLKGKTESIYQSGFDELIGKKDTSKEDDFYKYECWVPTTWVKFIIDVVECPMNYFNRNEFRRKIMWFWSEKGSVGKSTLIRYLSIFHGAEFIKGGDAKDIMNLIANGKKKQSNNDWNTYIFDIPRHQKNISWAGMEGAKDGMVCNMKSHTNKSLILPIRPLLFVFANTPPPYGNEKMSADRWYSHQIDWIDEIKNFDIRSLTPPRQTYKKMAGMMPACTFY